MHENTEIYNSMKFFKISLEAIIIDIWREKNHYFKSNYNHGYSVVTLIYPCS